MREKMIVVKVEGDWVHLAKEGEDFSCHSCPLKGICSRDENTIKVKSDMELKVGDIVQVEIPEGVAIKSSLIVYTLPLIVFLATLVVLKSLGLGDLISFALGLAAMGIYYTVLRMKERHVAEKFAVRIVEKEGQNAPYSSL